MKPLFFLGALVFAASAPAAENYDREMLAALGYDASIAGLLAARAHFLPGTHPVSLIINGNNSGLYPLLFDGAGSPCWEAPLLRKTGIDPRRFTARSPGCLQPARESGIRIVEQVERSTLLLHVPADALLRESHYATGGSALMANYDLRRYDYQTQQGKHRVSQTLTSELGANINQWILRSGQSYSAFDGEGRLTHLYRYAQRAFPDRAAVLQAGEIVTGDPLFPGITLTGLQLLPEQAARERLSLTVSLPRAGSVELWQGKILLKTYRVTAGINSLRHIPLLNQQDDFTLVSWDESGNRQQQIITRLQAQPEDALMAGGSAFAAGRLRLYQTSTPLMLASTGLLQTPQLALALGGLAGEGYQATAWRARLRLAGKLTASLSQTLSLRHANEARGAQRGVRHQATLSTPLTPQLSLSGSASLRSRRYRDIGNAWTAAGRDEESVPLRAQYAAGVSYASPALGSFSFSGSRSQRWQGAHTLGYSLAWGRAFGRVNVNLGVQKNRAVAGGRRDEDNYAYLNLAFALGRDSQLRSWASRSDGDTQLGTSYDRSVSPAFAWSLSSEQNARGAPALAGSATWTSKYSQLSGEVSRSAASRRLTLGARGGAVLHSEGLTFTPHSVGDTFSIISLRRALPDVALRTPDGTVWSDRSGQAIASLTPWQANLLQVDTATLPNDVQVPGGVVELTPVRGAVVPVALPAWRVRRALLRFPAAQRPQPGSAVENDQGRLVAFVGEDGTLFIDDLPSGTLYARRPDGARCAIALTTPWVDHPGSLYASLSARCLP